MQGGDGWIEFFPIGGEGNDSPIPCLRELDGKTGRLQDCPLHGMWADSNPDRTNGTGKPNPVRRKEHIGAYGTNETLSETG